MAMNLFFISGIRWFHFECIRKKLITKARFVVITSGFTSSMIKIDCDWKWTSFSSPRNLTPVLDEPDIKLRFTLITSGFISSIKFLLIAIRSLTSGIIQPQVYSVNIRSETTIKTTSGFISSMINIHRNDAKLIFQFRNISIPSGLIR